MKYIDSIKKVAHSQSINKVVSILESEFDIESTGQYPKQKLESVIALLKEKLEPDSELALEFEQLITSAYMIGAKSGFDRALHRFQDGKITTRKVRNEEEWILYSKSKRYRITDELPTINGVTKATVFLSLSDSGFE